MCICVLAYKSLLSTSPLARTPLHRCYTAIAAPQLSTMRTVRTPVMPCTVLAAAILSPLLGRHHLSILSAARRSKLPVCRRALPAPRRLPSAAASAASFHDQPQSSTPFALPICEPRSPLASAIVPLHTAAHTHTHSTLSKIDCADSSRIASFGAPGWTLHSLSNQHRS